MNVAGALAAATVVALGAALQPRATRTQLARSPDPRGSGDRVATIARDTGSSTRHRRWVPRSRSTPGSADALAQWCDEIARAARSGSTLSAAVRSAAVPTHIAGELAVVHLALDRGVSLATALEHAPAGDADAQLAFTVLRACAERGGPPAEPIDRAAATLRGRAADRAERRTHSAQAHLSAVVMTWLPIAMLGLLLITSASVRAAVTTPAGLLVVIAGAGLNLAGWRWMGRIIEGGR